MSKSIKILLGAALLAVVGLVLTTSPASAAVENDCYSVAVQKLGGTDKVTVSINNFDSMFHSNGKAKQGHRCFDIVHVDSMKLNGGKCVAVPLHPDHFGANWTKDNVKRSFSFNQEVNGSSLKVELFDHKGCHGRLGTHQKGDSGNGGGDNGGNNNVCSATGNTRAQAENNFTNQCSGRKFVDCDPKPGGGYICATVRMDGGVLPGSGGGNNVCSATGNNRAQAENNFTNQCSGRKFVDCDPKPGGGEICATVRMEGGKLP